MILLEINWVNILVIFITAQIVLINRHGYLVYYGFVNQVISNFKKYILREHARRSVLIKESIRLGVVIIS